MITKIDNINSQTIGKESLQNSIWKGHEEKKHSDKDKRQDISHLFSTGGLFSSRIVFSPLHGEYVLENEAIRQEHNDRRNGRVDDDMNAFPDREEPEAVGVYLNALYSLAESRELLFWVVC